MNDIDKISAELTLEQCDKLLVDGICSVRDAILGYTQHGLTQAQISDRVAELGFKASRRTIQRHVADLRDEGLLPAVGESRATQYRRKAEVSNRQIGAMRQPTEPEPTEPEAPKLAVLASEPLVAAAVEELQNPLAAVMAYAVATAEPAHPDGNKIVELLSAARQLLEKHYMRDELSSDEWESIYAHWHGCSYCIKSERNHRYKAGFNREGAVEVDCREA